ncbi:rRNA maturation RNase YbeY [Parasporobacterium paucivorans]|uniref:Endoribonuclease YbeY n=1 Tax=Parasporobacterium paucivorans DSM 15970 TaxID=1122934 RepID=A0A1M6A1C2_9FIRM|nr:rRNA maturation RNase YbeY [Parasporobacterium paucivorans]SHI30238.1 probable rRNA maturation factor [Parasporobacterium paucivorans DSM 15970]
MSVFIEEEVVPEFDFDYKSLLEEVIEEALDYMDCPYEAEINVILTDNENIQSINKEFREMDRPTDVLSFPMVSFGKPGDFSFLEEEQSCFNPETGELMLGDIILSVEKVREQAATYGHSEKRELAFLTAHSMLHLFGYDHIEEQDRILMEKLQEEILQKMNIHR